MVLEFETLPTLKIFAAKCLVKFLLSLLAEGPPQLYP